MNREEAAKLLALMQANYPDDFKTMSDDMLVARVRMWERIFEDDSYLEVETALLAHMASDTGRFSPPVGVIKNKLVSMRQGETMTELEAWGYVKAALRNSTYGSAAEFAKLPPVVQRLVGSPNQLREWAMMDSETVDSVVASNFQRSYKARAASEREYMALPSAVKGFVAQLAERMSMDKPRIGGGDG